MKVAFSILCLCLVLEKVWGAHKATVDSQLEEEEEEVVWLSFNLLGFPKQKK